MAAATCRVLQTVQMEVRVFIRLKGIFVSFFKHKICRDRIRKNEGIYTQKEKKRYI